MSAFTKRRERGIMLKSLSAKLGHVLVLYGGWGLFAMSFLDSSLIPFPVVNDLALIVMASKRPAWWPLYAWRQPWARYAAPICFTESPAAEGNSSFARLTPQSITHAQRWLERNDFVAVLVASILPPPAPYKVFILTAGVLRVNAVNFGLALLVGRGLRFAAEAWLGARYGVQAQDYLRHNLGWASLAAVILIVGLALLQAMARETGLGTRG